MIIDQISQAGTSIWLDDLSRAKLTGKDRHSLPHRIENDGIVGVTTNPSIFNSAISQGTEYADAIAALKGKSVDDVVRILTTDDVRDACDLFSPTFKKSGGVDGRVSIEVDPRLARDAKTTVEQGKELWAIVDRPNVLIKVPATVEGLGAITELTAAGISVNVTLIFSIERYLQSFEAFMQGLEERLRAGKEISGITSVASVFVSRIDASVDSLLKAGRSPAHSALLGRAAIANAALAYEGFGNLRNSDRWRNLEGHGARIQRPLWASTGVKDLAYDDTRYVMNLVGPDTVNTMPQATLDAVLDHGVLSDSTVVDIYQESHDVFESLEKLGISIAQVTTDLEIDGVSKFAAAWIELLSNVEKSRNA
ncbi:MAG TPA: transaldolase [Candidatus Paceibacterota bacterium]|nr:transaldolase [Candidatus Paceibacterota bacterium]